MKNKYVIEFTEDEIDFTNKVFKTSLKNINKIKMKACNRNVQSNKDLDLFYSVINKFYNAKE